jgi:two-component system nitrate/nitrite response regulator NarP
MAANSLEMLELLERTDVDIVLMDFDNVTEPSDQIDAVVETIGRIKREHPNVRIIVLTASTSKEIARYAVNSGVDGYLLLGDTDDVVLLDAIRSVLQDEMPIAPRITRVLLDKSNGNGHGHQHLTQRETEVLQLMARGFSNPKIAQILNLSQGTVKIHVSNILSKLHVGSRTEAVVNALQNNLISLSKN